jgi:hypothetical protein
VCELSKGGSRWAVTEASASVPIRAANDDAMMAYSGAEKYPWPVEEAVCADLVLPTIIDICVVRVRC